MQSKRFRSRTSVVWIFAGIGLVLALVWAFVVREASARATALEFEVFRNASALLETAMQDPDALAANPVVRGFGIYDAEGLPAFRAGAAPLKPDLEALASRQSLLVMGADSAILLRVLGAPQGRMGMMRSMGRRNPEYPAWPLAMSPLAARYLWIEYGLGAYRVERALLFSGATLASAVLLAAAMLVTRLSARNAELAERAARDRELVQLGEAARTIAHEIKNPLGIIRVQSAIARKRLGGVIDSSLAVIDAETRRLVDLADRIGVFLRSDEGQPEAIELGPFLKNYSVRYASACRLGAGLERLACTVRMDPERLLGVLDNLARNALDASEEAGIEGDFELDATEKRGRVEIRVSDRGHGVAEGSEERIFEPFYTTKAKGSGIGLAIALKWTERAGGQLRYQKREGGGAVFTLSLPLA